MIGGVELHAHYLSKAQAELGHNVTVLTTNSGHEPEYEFRDGYHIVRVKPLFRPLGNSFSPSLFLWISNEKKKFDIIHAHSHLYFSTNMCALARKFSMPPLIITNHGVVSTSVPLGFQSIYLNTFTRWTYEAADKIICYSDEDMAALEKLGINAEKISTIHNGVNFELFTPVSNSNTKNQILWIGRFVPGKGVEYLIDAFSLISGKFPDLRLLLVGDGPTKAAIVERIRTLNLGPRISIIDFVPNEEVPILYRNSDIFVLPSLFEGVPRTILEAMSCGVPVVCTDLPQLKRIVDKCGITVPVKNHQLLADAISIILSDKNLRKDMSKNGRERIQKCYSWGDTVKRTLTVYEEVISDNIRNQKSNTWLKSHQKT